MCVCVCVSFFSWTLVFSTFSPSLALPLSLPAIVLPFPFLCFLSPLFSALHELSFFTLPLSPYHPLPSLLPLSSDHRPASFLPFFLHNTHPLSPFLLFSSPPILLPVLYSLLLSLSSPPFIIHQRSLITKRLAEVMTETKEEGKRRGGERGGKRAAATRRGSRYFPLKARNEDLQP